MQYEPDHPLEYLPGLSGKHQWRYFLTAAHAKAGKLLHNFFFPLSISALHFYQQLPFDSLCDAEFVHPFGANIVKIRVNAKMND
ncbi:MAG: hypothetical protein IJ088_11450 [Clostridia bacterium]|nr:hypothetical protein [Clostridia bacterium]